MQFEIKKATKAQAKARVALMGPAGSGKTFSALNLAAYLGARVVVIDTERGSASKYADEFEFSVIELDTFSPRTYTEAIRAAEAAGADVIIIDSLSHAWIGKDGALEMVDRASSNAPGAGAATLSLRGRASHLSTTNSLTRSCGRERTLSPPCARRPTTSSSRTRKGAACRAKLDSQLFNETASSTNLTSLACSTWTTT